MKALLPVLAVAAALVAATPVFAQSLDITVPGGRRIVAPESLPSFNSNRYIYSSPWTTNHSFDPAQAAINALNVSHFYPRRNQINLNLERAFTLEANGESLLEHQLACQAAYETYDLVSDTYIGPHGIPRPCRL